MRRQAFDETFEVTHADDLDAALSKVRKGDADVAVEMRGDTLVAHYTQTDQVQGRGHRRAPCDAFVDGANQARLRAAAALHAARPSGSRTSP